MSTIVQAGEGEVKAEEWYDLKDCTALEGDSDKDFVSVIDIAGDEAFLESAQHNEEDYEGVTFSEEIRRVNKPEKVSATDKMMELNR